MSADDVRGYVRDDNDLVVTAERSIWLDELTSTERAALDPGPPIRLDERPDVLVVGGGIVGVSTAVACQEAGLGSVVLIEADRLGAGATGGGAGLLIPEAHQGTDPTALVELGRASLEQWRQLHATRPGGVGLLDLDWIGLAPHPEGFVANPSPAVSWLDADEVAGLVPGLATPVTGAHIRNQARVNPLRALARLAVELPQVATRVAATAVRIGGRRVNAVSTTAGMIAPGAVVFATGSPPALNGIDLGIPADMIKGHLLVTEPAPVRLAGSVAPIATQLADGRLLVGGTLDVGDLSPTVRLDVIEAIRAELAAALPSLRNLGVTNRWCCFRPHHPDGLPVIDQVPGLDNAWVTSGHYRTGILMGPGVGTLLAEWIATSHSPALATPWAIERLAKQQS